MRKRIFALLLVFTMIFAVVACANDAGGGGDATPAAEAEEGDDEPAVGNGDLEPVNLRFTGWGAPGEVAATQAVIRAFEDANPHVSVEYIHIPDDYETALTTMIAAGEGPDMGMLNGITTLAWAQEGQLIDINSFFQADPTFSVDEIAPQAIYWLDEDTIVGINAAIVSFALFYSREAIDEAGVDVPKSAGEAWTWDEFVHNLQLLTLDMNGNNALDPNFDPDNIMQYGIFFPIWPLVDIALAQAGESFLNEDETAVNILGTRTEEAIQRFADLINVYNVAPSPAEMAILPGGTVALLTRQTAMTLDGSWCIMDLSDNEVDFGIGVMPRMWDVPATISLGEPFVIFATCEHPEYAYQLLRNFMQPEHSMGLIAGGLWKPVLREWFENEEKVDMWAGPNEIYPPEFRTALMLNTLENGVPTRTYTIRNLPRINEILGPALDAVWTGDISVAEAVASVQELMDAEVQGTFPRPE